MTIAGDTFESVTSVDFGATPAAGFTVKSDKSIVATSPSAQAGPVSISVTTIAGTSAPSAGSTFTYTGPPTTTPVSMPSPKVQCVVPRLKGKTLKASQRRLGKAHCKLGRVRGDRNNGARVRKQRPGPGKVLPANAKVSVKLGSE